MRDELSAFTFEIYHSRRQCGHINSDASAHDSSCFQDIFEFPDVAWPAISPEACKSIVINAEAWLA